MALTMKYKDPAKPELDEIAQEINGFDLTTGKRLDSFAKLKDDGTTTAGDWIYTGSYPEAGNLSKRRNGIQDPAKNDPTGMGYYHGWAWSWPLNRRVMYNRASADLEGRPWDPDPARASRGTRRRRSGSATSRTTRPRWIRRDPKAWGPFIMNGEGVGRLFSSSMLDGPFPEHYEPMEAPIPNPLHPNQSESPVAFLYDKAAGRDKPFGTVKDYPYVATSYRLTEHEHYVTQHVPHLVGLQPAPFVEVPEELAREKSIRSGDRVRVSSKRGKLEVAAIVTKRLGPVQVGGQEGLPDRHPDPLGLRRHLRRPGSRPRERTGWPTRSRRSWGTPTPGRPSSRRSWSTSRRSDAGRRRRAGKTAWTERRRRASELTEQYPHAAQQLGLYAALLEVQEPAFHDALDARPAAADAAGLRRRSRPLAGGRLAASFTVRRRSAEAALDRWRRGGRGGAGRRLAPRRGAGSGLAVPRSGRREPGPGGAGPGRRPRAGGHRRRAALPALRRSAAGRVLQRRGRGPGDGAPLSDLLPLPPRPGSSRA